MKHPTKQAYQLMHDGAIALAGVEANGIRIDTAYLDRTIEKVEGRIKELTERLKQDKVFKTWRGVYGRKTNLGSRKQLGRILFDELEHPCEKRTKPSKSFPNGQPSANASNLERLELPFVKRYLRVEKLKKLRSTYLMGVRREVVDGFLHPSFNLHLVRTFRSSSNSPNFKNIPIRDKQIGRLIRRAFIPRKGHVLVEVDYGAIEVRVAACYHKDPTMLKYIEDGYDLHRDMAAECYACKPSQVSKDMRYCAKNMFVFPQFYGDYHVNCARHLWEAIDRMKLESPDLGPIRDWFRRKDINSLSVFTDHIERVEGNFWGERFPVYTDWKKEWLEKYNRRGWLRMKTGFVVQGVMRKNEIINYPIQGSAFHCLLWSLIRLRLQLRKHKMRSMVVGEIYDSMLLDVYKPELDVVMAMAKEIMVDKLREAWKWIITPLSVEAEVSETNWHEKEEVEL